MSVETALVKVNNITVYQSDVDMIAEDYISGLPDSNMIYKSAVFTGLLDSIYKRLLKLIITKDYGKTNSSYNYDILDNIFRNIYIPLCYRFNITPTVIAFCTLCNISNQTISAIKKGVYRDGRKVNQATNEIIQKWYDICESGLVGKVIDSSSIGSMFILKSVFGYQESQTIRVESGINDNHETAAEISAKHSNAMLPQKPNLNSSE